MHVINTKSNNRLPQTTESSMKWCNLKEKGKKQHKNGTQRFKKSFIGN